MHDGQGEPDRDNENDAGVLGIAGVAVIDLADDEDDGEDELCDSPGQERTEGAREVTVSDELSEEEDTEIRTLLDDFEDVLSDVPGVTTLGVHDIKLTTNEPVRTKPYPLPFVSRDTVCEEVRKMIEAGVVEPLSSPYCSPIVILKKKDGTNRFCIDFRAINKITVFMLKQSLTLMAFLFNFQVVDMCLNSIFLRATDSYRLGNLRRRSQHSRLRWVCTNFQ